ncbi:MAG: glycosyltransferase family 4 protein [Deltaproteobacteria bacterium]|nr:glycosyltransferase family 4 protein [Deltaproteobacteria bacterium]
MLLLWLFVAALILTMIAGFPAYWLLKRIEVIDQPNRRSSHDRPTVKGGGIAILGVVLLLGGWIACRSQSSVLAVLLVGASILAVISMQDDIRGLPVIVRFVFHFIAAIMAILVLDVLGWTLAMSPVYGKVVLTIFIIGLSILWIAGYTNAFNFMDGIDGIAAGQAALTGLGTALVGGVATGKWEHPAVLFSLVLAGAALGFLPHNFPKARMFMGDVGSAPLGFLLAALVLWLASEFGLWILIPLTLLHTNFILDTGITLIRRIYRGERFYEAHREHFYQRLVRSGKSHVFVTSFEAALSALVILLMVSYAYVGKWGKFNDFGGFTDLDDLFYIL